MRTPATSIVNKQQNFQLQIPSNDDGLDRCKYRVLNKGDAS